MVSSRLLLVAASAALLLIVFVVAYVVVEPVLGPFTKSRIPNDCSIAVSRLPASRDYPVPGYGTGTLLVENASAAAVVRADYGQMPFAASVFIIDRSRQQVMRTLSFADDIIGAGFDGGTLYVFNDAIGYFIDSSDGALLSNIVETDNYRELFTANGYRYVQSDITVSALTGDWHVIVRHHFHMVSVAYGCWLP